MNKKLTLVFIMLTLMLDAAGFGIIMPVLPNLIETVGHVDLSEAAQIGGYLLFGFGLSQFVFGPFIGNLSDAYGRRPVLLVSLVGLVADYIIMALAPSVMWLMIGRVLGGITSATHATANAVVADISDDDEKAVNFGLIGAAFGIGFILGPMLGGILSLFGERAPFWGAAIIAMGNLIFGTIVFRETLPKENRRPFRWARANPVGSFYVLKRQRGLWAFVLIFFFYNLSFTVYPSVWSFFTIHRYGFEPWMVAATLTLFGVMMALSQGFLVKPAMARLGARKIVNYGLITEAVVFALYAFAFDWRLILFIVPLSAIASVTGPAFQDLITRMVAKSEQGELQGIITSMISLSMLIGTIIMTQSFSYFTANENGANFDGAPFLLSALSALIGWLIYHFVVHKSDVQSQLDASSDRLKDNS